MKSIKLVTFLFIAFFVASCSTSIRTTLADKSIAPLVSTQKIAVIGVDEPLPEGKKIGSIKIGDSGFTNDCGYNTVIEQAQAEARKAGGNSIKLTKVKPPTLLGSTCYRIHADIYLLSNPDSYESKITKIQDSITKSKFTGTPDHALLYIYRPSSGGGFLLNYTVKLDGKPLYKVTNNSRTVVKVYKEGLQKISGSLETEEVKELDIKFGEEYFIECGINMGIVIGRPEINLVDKAMGRMRYEKIPEDKN
jgi:hypothetical protein